MRVGERTDRETAGQTEVINALQVSWKVLKKNLRSQLQKQIIKTALF